MHTIPVAPRAARSRKRASNAPGDGAAVSGSVSERSSRSQNSSARQLDLVDELLVTEPDGERHDLDAERLDEWCREIAGAVGDHAYAHGSDRYRPRGAVAARGRAREHERVEASRSSSSRGTTRRQRRRTTAAIPARPPSTSDASASPVVDQPIASATSQLDAGGDRSAATTLFTMVVASARPSMP